MQFNWTSNPGTSQENPTRFAGRVIPGLGFYRYAAKQPNWVTRTAFTVFALVVAVPILLLFFLAILAAGVVFGTLALVNALTGSFRRGIGNRGNRGRPSAGNTGAGRQNVKILPRK